MFKRLCYMATVLLLFFALPMSAQNTAPVSTSFRILQAESRNSQGDLLKSATLETEQIDALLPFSIRIVVANGDDSLATVFDVTSKYGRYTPVSEQITVPLYQQLYLPQSTSGNHQVPDSIYSVVLNDQKATVGEEFNLFLRQIPVDQPGTQILVFDNDSLRGTAVDSSSQMAFSRGTSTSSFGFFTGTANTAATYEVLYNTGYGWGLATPSDTLADSLSTVQCPANTWRYFDSGALMEAEYIKIIRRGMRAADTILVKQTLRIRP